MPQFTHKFEFKINDIEITGEAEFDTDNTASYKTNNPLPRMNVEELGVFSDLFIYLKRVYDRFNGFNKIEIKKK